MNNVISTVGRQVWGKEFDPLMPNKQEAVVVQYLQAHRCLLIWDNFEPVAGFPAGNQPLLTEPERQRLQQWLKVLRGGQSWVLITSRREEPWLDCGYWLLPLRGLSLPARRWPGLSDSEVLAAKILETVGVRLADLPEEYLELLKLLRGHPLSLRVVLPHLQRQSPVVLMEALRQGLDTFAGAEEEGREKSLTVSLDYSFAALSERAQRHLPFLAFLSERVNVDVLCFFSSSEAGDKYRKAYEAVFGEKLQKANWLSILEEAATAGILEPLSSTIFQIHPALPWYLRQRLHTASLPTLVDGGSDTQFIFASEVIADLEEKFLDFYGAFAQSLERELISNSEHASLFLQVEQPNLLQKLRFAEQRNDWENAQWLLQALGELYKRTGYILELKALCQQALVRVGINLNDAKAKGKKAFNFWIYLRGREANDYLQIADLEGALAIYQEILIELQNLQDSTAKDEISSVYYPLGVILLKKRCFDDAISYFEKVLTIREDTGDLSRAANAYHALGFVAQEQRRFDDAISYFEKALEIKEGMNNKYGAAEEYHHMGRIAEEKRRFDLANTYYKKALDIYEDAGDLLNLATEYHQLGSVAQQQGHFDDANIYYRKALKIHEDADNQYDAADEYHNLGIVAQEQGYFNDANAFYKKALTIKEDADDYYATSMIYHQMGMAAQRQGRFDDAISYFDTAIKIKEDNGYLLSSASTYGAIGLLMLQQKQLDKALENICKSVDIFIKADDVYRVSTLIPILNSILFHLGDTKFKFIWQKVTDAECPQQLYSAIQQAGNPGDT